MSRLIYADALKEEFYRKMKELLLSTDTPQISNEALSLLCGASLIADAPTIEERKQGRWLPDNRPGGGFWVCSCCKFPSEAFAADKLYKYCPVCGADMRQGEGEKE